MKSILDAILSNIVKSKIIFTNELEFQFYLAQQLKLNTTIKEVLFEVPSFSTKWSTLKSDLKSISKKDKQYTDLVVCFNNGQHVAIELKYKTPNKAYLYSTPNGEVLTMAQGAYDLGAYSFLRDINRLVDILTKKRFYVNDIRVDQAYVIFLTNDSNYRDNSLIGGTGAWKNFAINDGRIIPSIVLTPPEGYNSLKPLDLSNLKTKKPLDWNPIIKNKITPPEFSYVVFEVEA